MLCTLCRPAGAPNLMLTTGYQNIYLSLVSNAYIWLSRDVVGCSDTDIIRDNKIVSIYY